MTLINQKQVYLLQSQGGKNKPYFEFGILQNPNCPIFTMQIDRIQAQHLNFILALDLNKIKLL